MKPCVEAGEVQISFKHGDTETALITPVGQNVFAAVVYVAARETLI